MLGRTEREIITDSIAEIKAKSYKKALQRVKEKIDPEKDPEAIKYINEQIDDIDDIINNFRRIERLDHKLKFNY